MAGVSFKSLRTLAKDIQSNLQKYAPIDTGNLRDRLRSANTVNTIIGKNSYEFNFEKKSYDVLVSVEVAPDGAEYGVWFNDPPPVQSQRRKSLQQTAKSRGNWDFGQRSIDDAIYKNLDAFADEIAENMANQIEVMFDKF
jgi:outer membrane protein OmpA-like peptidoglycan-associated protein